MARSSSASLRRRACSSATVLLSVAFCSESGHLVADPSPITRRAQTTAALGDRQLTENGILAGAASGAARLLKLSEKKSNSAEMGGDSPPPRCRGPNGAPSPPTEHRLGARTGPTVIDGRAGSITSLRTHRSLR